MKISQREINQRLWREWTLRATEVNCCKIYAAVADDHTAAQLLRYIQGYSVGPAVRSQIADVANGRLVPAGLDCTLRGVEQRNHLMYKIEPLEAPSGRATYEFLIEYDRFEPHVGIYFGCKCITHPDADHEALIPTYMDEWNSLRLHVCTVLNNSFPTKEFRHRFRMTNNADNGTFWPFWIGLYDDEDVEFALTVLRIIRKAYSQYFAGTLTPCAPLKPIAFRRVPASFTDVAYRDMLATVGRAFRPLGDEAADLFNTFIIRANEAGIFAADPSYDLAWRYRGHASWGLTGSNIEYSTLMHELFLAIGERFGSSTEVKVPWEQLNKLFLDAEGVAFKAGTRTQWQSAKTDTVALARRVLAALLTTWGQSPQSPNDLSDPNDPNDPIEVQGCPIP